MVAFVNLLLKKMVVVVVALTPAIQAGTRFTYPGGMEG